MVFKPKATESSRSASLILESLETECFFTFHFFKTELDKHSCFFQFRDDLELQSVDTTLGGFNLLQAAA